MDVLFILRDALGSSVVGGVAAALEVKKAGNEPAVLFTEEALAALAGGSFGWPRELSGERVRKALADRGAEAGLPVRGRGDGRQLDPKALVASAHEAGVALYACPLWASLLGLEGSLPAGLRLPGEGGVAALLREAKQVVGSF